MNNRLLYFPPMSIAVSAVVKPSKVLFAMSVGLCMGAVWIGLMAGSGRLGELDVLSGAVFAAASVCIGLFGIYCTVQTRKRHHIDISGIGQIRLAEHSPLATSSYQSATLHGFGNGEVVSLMADSTLWPSMLILRLKTEDGRITVVPILPDSMSGEEFRSLSVACRWIATHNNPAEHTHL